MLQLKWANCCGQLVHQHSEWCEEPLIIASLRTGSHQADRASTEFSSIINIL